jgi:hypothetical protein
MDKQTILRLRLINQHIAQPKPQQLTDLAGSMGAIQAQDAAMAKWAMGCRLPSVSQTQIDQAILNGSLVRTHLLRPTWHLVSATDIDWMLDLTSEALKRQLKTRHNELNITTSLIDNFNTLIINELRDNKMLTKDSIRDLMLQHKLTTDNNQLYHLLFLAEINKLLCSGGFVKNKNTYALYSERIQSQPILNREEAILKLASIYFSSRGPASLQDFAWWSGLGLREASLSQSLIGNGFDSFSKGKALYIYPQMANSTTFKNDEVYLLPAFDEYLISYADRSAAISQEKTARAISSNGIFRPIVIINGEVAGIWKRETRKDTLHIGLELFNTATVAQKNALHEKAVQFGKFNSMNVSVTF